MPSQASGKLYRGAPGGDPPFCCTDLVQKTKQATNNYRLEAYFHAGVLVFPQETCLIFAVLMTVSGVNPIIGIGVIFIVFEVNPLSIVQGLPEGLSNC